MRFLVLATMALLPAGSAAAPAPTIAAQGAIGDGQIPWINPNATASRECPPISRFHAQQSGAKLGATPLADLPAADVYKTAYRMIDGCEAPIIAGYGIGAQR